MSRTVRQSCIVAVAVLLTTAANVHAFDFDDIEFWVGSGSKRAAIAIDWFENVNEPPALVWGYRWDGDATGYDMLHAIVAADDRLFVKLGDSFETTVVYGLGYDKDNDGVFGVRKTTIGGGTIDTVFDGEGFATSNIPDSDGRRGTATDAGDYYFEGWNTAFWHMGHAARDDNEVPMNPYTGGSWVNTESGIDVWPLVDGTWESWAYEMPALPPYTAYAVNPEAAPSPFPPGDYNRDTHVDDLDFDTWKLHYGATDEPNSDGNHDGVVDALDYSVWRNHFVGGSGGLATPMAVGVPEPNSIQLVGSLMILVLQFTRRRRKETRS